MAPPNPIHPQNLCTSVDSACPETNNQEPTRAGCGLTCVTLYEGTATVLDYGIKWKLWAHIEERDNNSRVRIESC